MGPQHYHVVILDNGRSSVLGTKMQDMLRCIRCGACMNHCPVYGAIGGHAYGWVYPGPIGAVLTPQLIGVEEAGNLPNASTFCGRCESVCPVRIPLPALMRHWREREFERHLTPRAVRQGLALWAFIARRPKLYRRLTRPRQPAAGAVRPRHRPLPRPAAGRRMDAVSRLPGPAGRRHVPCSMGAARRSAHTAMSETARSQILNGIRRSLHRGELCGVGPAGGRSAARPRRRAVRPLRAAELPQAERVALFCQWAEFNNATVARVAPAEVASEVAAYLARNNLPAEAAMAPSPQLDGYDWAGQKMLALRRGAGRGSDQVSITGAFAGIAETGTLVMASGPDHPVTPQSAAGHPHRGAARGRHRRRLRGGVGQAARSATARTACRARSTPSPGHRAPATSSRRSSSGAHGPRRLHIVVVRE